MEIEKSMRYRVNVSTSVKGVKTWDCTCDGEYKVSDPNHALPDDYAMRDILERSDKLVAELEKRYPITEVR
uniref:Uncharacterized protein n=1 Tax=viral metagenome TaxID=1070528 RepID=A0A6M3JHH7_9ZZZZ